MLSPPSAAGQSVLSTIEHSTLEETIRDLRFRIGPLTCCCTLGGRNVDTVSSAGLANKVSASGLAL